MTSGSMGMTPMEKNVVDAGAVATATMGVFIDSMPAIALALSIIWSVIRIYETDTVKCLVKRLFKGKVDGETTKPE